MAESEIIQAAIRGDPAAFKRLVDKHCRAVFGMARHCLNSEDDARDVTQETFVKAYLQLAQLTDTHQFRPWLRKIALNECVMWCRRRARREKAQQTCNPDAPVETEQLTTDHAVGEATTGLTADSRLAVTLCYVAKASHEAIAAVLGYTSDAVNNRLRDARNRLREQMADVARVSTLPVDFSEQILRAAMACAREPERGDACYAFAEATHVLLTEIQKAANRQSASSGVDFATVMTTAAATWLGEADSASELFAQAMDRAETASDRPERAHALQEAYLTQLRRGEFASAKRHADAEARLLYRPDEACARCVAHAASALTSLLPGRWTPGTEGGYAFGALLLQPRSKGWRLNRPPGHRNYSWGMPEFSSVYGFLWRFGDLIVNDPQVGDHVTGEVDASPSYAAWKPQPDEPLIVVARVESVTDRIVTPAGVFEKCLRIVFSVKPREREFATTHITRTVAGRTLAWFARGVGLVKVTRVDQNEYHARSAYLRDYKCSDRRAYFPVSSRATWTYTWTSAWDGAEDQGIFEEQVTCFPGQDGTVCMALACVARHLDQSASGNRWQTLLKYERAGDDVNGHAEALRCLIRSCAKSSPKQASTLCEELLALWERHNDAWNALNAREALARLDVSAPDHAVSLVHQRLRFARVHGHRRRAAECLAALARDCRAAGRLIEANGFAQDAARAYESLGDVDGLTWARSLIEGIQHSQRHRANTALFRVEGAWEIEDCSGVLRPSHSVRMWVPPREGSPIHDLASSGCALALEVLSRPVGERTHSWDHIALLDGSWAHVRATRWLKAESENVTVVAGTFTGCRLVEVTIRASTDPVEPSRSALRGYIGATILAWFAPGVGCVRVTHHHDNGTTTDLQLTSFHTIEPNAGPFPLMVGNRWVYMWTDELTGAKFEDTVFVAARRNARWHLAFVTVGTPGVTSKVLPSRAKLLYRTQEHADCR